MPDEAISARTTRSRTYRLLSRNRRPFFVVHKWLSIVLLLWVVMECVTGSILVFRPEIERAWNRSDFQVTEGDQIGVEEAVASTLATSEGAVLNDVSLPGRRRIRRHVRGRLLRRRGPLPPGPGRPRQW